MAKKFGYDSKQLHALFYRVLENDDVPLEEQNGEEECRESVMEQIQELLHVCYMLGINPLRELRRILPQYKWQYTMSRDMSHIKSVVWESDFIWRVNWTEDDGEIQLVTATEPIRKGLKWFWVGVKFDSLPLSKQIEFVEVCRGNPVYWEASSE